MSKVLWLSCGMADVPSEPAWLAPAEAARFDSMSYTKRWSEARLGRWTAKNAVARILGLNADHVSLSEVVIRNAHDGAPEVTVGGSIPNLVIAMTDRADWAVAMLREGEERIGCDLELVEPRSARFVTDYFTTAEQHLVGLGDPPLRANLIWSAKESALKVLRTGLRRDTRTVEVIVESFEPAEDWQSLEVTVDGVRRLTGWWIRYGDFVLTCAAATRIDPPVGLVDPPALASAVPGHSWMDRPVG